MSVSNDASRVFFFFIPNTTKGKENNLTFLVLGTKPYHHVTPYTASLGIFTQFRTCTWPYSAAVVVLSRPQRFLSRPQRFGRNCRRKTGLYFPFVFYFCSGMTRVLIHASSEFCTLTALYYCSRVAVVVTAGQSSRVRVDTRSPLQN